MSSLALTPFHDLPRSVAMRRADRRAAARRQRAIGRTLLLSLFLLGPAVRLSAEEPETKQKPARPQARNVLLLVSDDLKASVLGCYGDRVGKTPNIDRLAARGMLFRRAYCQGTWCRPSRLSMMYSQYEGASPNSARPNLGEHLRANGFHSARVGKIFHMRVPGDIIDGTHGDDVAASWDERFNSAGREAHTPGDYACLNLNIFTDALEGRQSTRMPHRMFVTVRYRGDGSDQPDYKTADKTMELLRRHKESGQPFFLAAGFVRPHYPMVAPEQYFAPYSWQAMRLPEAREGDLDDIPRAGWAGTRSGSNSIGKHPDNQRRMWAGYYAAVSFMDAQVGRVLDELDRLGLSETTAIVFTSDHGYHLGEHTFWQKSNLHEDVTRVPLIISAPGIKPGATDALAELVDLYPTLADLVAAPAPEGLDGVNLAPVLRNSAAVVREGALSLHQGHSWRTRDWAYMRYNDGSEELYDMRDDPGQFDNLAQSDPHRETKAQLAGQLDEQLKRHGLARAERSSAKKKKRRENAKDR
ncbi:MAG: sulfatase [Planctomycetales bacterium]|nr:sulfatase [Planctomycetales bacterium]